MTIISWDETNPSANDPLRELGGVWRSFKTAFRGGFEQSFYVTASSVSTGQALVSSSTPGVCRAYYGPRSEVSFPQRTGTLMVVSDESRLLGFGSAGSSVIGSSRAHISLIGTSVPANVKHLVDSGSANLQAGGNAIAYSSAFASATKGPVTVFGTLAGSNASFTFAIFAIGNSGFSVWATQQIGGPDPGTTLHWRSTATSPL